jgi:hypothetical protein
VRGSDLAGRTGNDVGSVSLSRNEVADEPAHDRGHRDRGRKCGISCSKKESCPDGDLACLSAGVSWSDFVTGSGDIYGTPDALASVDVDKVLALPTTSTMRLTATSALDFPEAGYHALLLLSWSDPLGCRPSFCLSQCPRGVRCIGSARCTALRADGRTSGNTQHWVSYEKAPATSTSYDLQIVAVSAPGCPSDLTAKIAAGEVTLKVSPPLRLPVTWTLPDTGGGGGTCAGGGLHCSTRLCLPDGVGGCQCGGSTDYCLGAAEFAGATGGLPLPSACAPQGTTACFSSSVGTTVKPCCPGLSCKLATVCGGTSVVGGTCLP